jgi:multicomponent Na+:H+ antiporter subunit D
MAVVYIWKVVEVAYFQEAPSDGVAGDRPAEVGGSSGVRVEPIVEAPLAMLIPTWALITANFYFGIDASFTSRMAGSAARVLFGLAP